MTDISKQHEKTNEENLKFPPPTAAPSAEQTEQNETPEISEIKKLSILRDTFKRETQAILDESLKNIQEEKQSKLLKVKKLRRLANTNKSLLSQMHNQRTTHNKRLGELAKLCQSFSKSIENSQKEDQITAEDLRSTTDSIKKQLEGLRNN